MKLPGASTHNSYPIHVGTCSFSKLPMSFSSDSMLEHLQNQTSTFPNSINSHPQQQLQSKHQIETSSSPRGLLDNLFLFRKNSLGETAFHFFLLLHPLLFSFTSFFKMFALWASLSEVVLGLPFVHCLTLYATLTRTRKVIRTCSAAWLHGRTPRNTHTPGPPLG